MYNISYVSSPRAKCVGDKKKNIENRPYVLFQMITPQNAKFSQTVRSFSSGPVDRLVTYE